MRVEVKWHQDLWQDIKNATMTTISKNTGKYPDSAWKKKLLKSEHSPVRIGKIIVKCYDVPSWVSVHICRHHLGIEKFVSTQRTDRTGTNRADSPQGALVDMTLDMNFQAIINISRKRLCKQASKETQDLWKLILEQVKAVEPELYELCVPDCEYRGECCEFFNCGYYDALFDKKARKQK